MKPHPDFDTFVKLNTPPELAGDCTNMDGEKDCLERGGVEACDSCNHFATLMDVFYKLPTNHNTMHTDLYCKCLHHLSREQAIRAIHEAWLQLTAQVKGTPNLDHDPAIASLRAALATSGHPGFILDGPKLKPKVETPFRPDHTTDSHGPTNGDRASRAEIALTAYRGLDQPDESHFADLLNDLMHLAHRDNVDFENYLASASRRFAEEQ